MKDIAFAFGLLLVGFIALEMRATRDPYDYRQALLADKNDKGSLANALEQALKHKEMGGVKAPPAPAK